MPDVVFTVDQARSMREQAVPGHNRWHPDIPPAVHVRPGQSIRVQCRDWTDGQIGNNDSANDVRDVDLSHAHMLSGPIFVEGAEPGDLLVVDILDLGPVRDFFAPVAADVDRLLEQVAAHLQVCQEGLDVASLRAPHVNKQTVEGIPRVCTLCRK